GWWLPAGPMRERASRLRSVDAVIVNGGEAQQGEIPMRLQPGQAINLKTGERRDVRALSHIVAMAGIGHPPRFFATLVDCGVQPEKCIALADHQALSHAQVSAFTEPGQTLVMTEKDAVKCRAVAEEHWWYLPVDAQLAGEMPEHLLRELLTLAHNGQEYSGRAADHSDPLVRCASFAVRRPPSASRRAGAPEKTAPPRPPL